MIQNEQKVEEILRTVGLNGQEARVYLALLRLQESQTGEICKFSNIASSNIYKILDSLIQKGLANYRVKNNIKIFMPASPETLNELFLEKEKRLNEERAEITKLISNLKTDKPEEPYSKYRYYEGFVNVKSMWYEINSILTNLDKKAVIKIYTAQKEAYERMVGFYDEYHKLRNKLHIKQQMIFPFEDKKLAEKREKQLSEIKFMDLKNDVEWGVVGNQLFMQYITGNTPRGFLIQDEKFAKTFEQVFDKLWKLAKN
jgi:sugar-specific transcriptional regulator TrmB